MCMVRQEMRGDRERPNVIHFNLAMRALATGGQWERALELLEEMRSAGVSPDDRTFRTAIEVTKTEGGGGVGGGGGEGG